MTSETRSKWSIFLSMFIFGTIGVFVRYISLPSSVIACVRGFVGAAFLVAVLAVRRKKINLLAVKSNLLWLVLSGIAMGFNWILLFEAYRYTSVAVATLCYYMAPILVILAAPILLKERLTRKKVLCVLAAVCGMFCISGVLQSGIPEAGDLKGILLGLSAAVLYATVVLINKQIHGMGACEKTMLQLGIAAVTLLPYCLFTVDFGSITLDTVSLGMLLFVGVVHTGMTYFLYFSALEHVTGQTAAVISYVDPVIAVLASVLILAEPLSWVEGFGAALILGAAFVCEVPMGRKKVRG